MKQFVEVLMDLLDGDVGGSLRVGRKTHYGVSFAVTDANGQAHTFEAVAARDGDQLTTSVMPMEGPTT